MKQNSVKVIGIKDESRKDAHLSCLDKADGLKAILSCDFDDWSNFDSWENISVQQWIFSRALDVFRGKKIDIKCDCCEHNDLILNDFESIKKEKCFGKKSAYMIEKVVDEIVLAKIRRESDGTYSA
ncbi:phosphoenolpyruvate carboxykinase [Prochlorococcus sp. AH-736-E15]|nr:phosphoenolpyruvate carboxykinase [Prochlorococcus sp. AH-736-E15]